MRRPLLDDLPKLPRNGLTAVELFAGGGLMRLGVEHAGIKTIWANDFDKHACRAHEHNFGVGSILQGDITQISLDDIPNADIVIGGPPCQDFSIAGKGAGEEGERGKLVWRYLEIIAAKKPKAFLFENVKGLTQKKHRHTLDALLVKFEEIGYDVTWRIISAWDYGVAQTRERVFIVGIRKDMGMAYKWPQTEFLTTGYRPVLRDAIGDLPEPGLKLRPIEVAYLERNPASVAKNRPVTMDEPSRTIPAVMGKGVPYGLFYPDNSHSVIQSMIVKSNNYGQRNYVADWDKPAKTVCTNRLDHAEIHPGCPKNHTEKDYWTPKSEYTYSQANRIMSMDEPCNTIPAHHNSGQPIHPLAAPRRFTVRECLRIQSVPDSYTFPADMGLGAMYRIVGNGVASRVAYHLCAKLSEQLPSFKPKRIW